MKNNLITELMGLFLSHATGSASSRKERRATRAEYHRIMAHAGDIGKGNCLLSAYNLGAWFIAMNRSGHRTPEENCAAMESGLRGSRLFRIVMGDADHYLDPKRIQKQKKWAESTHRRQYPSDWVVDLIPGNGCFDLGYDYLECGICKMCQAEGCPELASYLCRLDFLFAEIMGLHLDRTTTLAEGGSHCDFRFRRK